MALQILWVRNHIIDTIIYYVYASRIYLYLLRIML